MNEKPLERLNYFNGQRLQAADLKLEQDYHIRVRRWLNRSLYSAGIAEGLAVYAIPGEPRVRVTPGLAIDHLGREIILLEERTVDIVGGHHERDDGKCDGPFLSIRYDESVLGKEDGCCTVGTKGSDRPAWGGPARILSGAALELSVDLPNDLSGRIPLACLTLAEGCGRVDIVDSGVRRYIGEGSANKVKQYALEGVRDLDFTNPATIVFHVRGRQPTSVTLYLQSEKFPSMFYTEMGSHTHDLNVELKKADGQHRHTLGTYTTKADDTQDHHAAPILDPSSVGPLKDIVKAVDDIGDALFDFFAGIVKKRHDTAPAGYGFVALKRTRHTIVDFTDPANEIVLRDEVVPAAVPNEYISIGGGQHSHTYGSTAQATQYTITGDVESAHSHGFATSNNDPAGVKDTTPEKFFTARTGGEALSFVEDLLIEIDKTPVTPAVLAQINGSSADAWPMIGTGTGAGADYLADPGTGPIRIDFLVPLGEGAHTIKLSLRHKSKSKSKKDELRNGGRIHFNLYVE